jgi:valyl-tRNA synthetase
MLHGKRARHPFVDRTIPIITDAILVDPKFGTGAVKVTPAHDFNDFATGKRHGLEEINILELDGTLNANAGRFAGLDRKEARRP